MSHDSTIDGTYGHTSPQPIVTAQSACNWSSTSSFRGRLPERSIPTSRMTSTTLGHTSWPGSEPRDSARTSSGASRSKNACAICERPALWVQMNSTYFIASSLPSWAAAQIVSIDNHQFNRYT